MRRHYKIMFFLAAVMAAALTLSFGVSQAQDKPAAEAAAPAAAAPAAEKDTAKDKTAKTEALWTKRCETEGEKKGQCELFQRLIVKETGKRVVEFAVGYPEKKDEARGVIVLPLGILLTEGVKLQIDAGQTFSVKPRYCGPEGCYAYVNLNKQMLDLMRKGKEAGISFQTLQGKTITVKLSLEGFGKSLKEIG